MQAKDCARYGLVGVFLLSGCGTYVPDTQDFPGNQGDQQLLVASVVQSVHCEVSNAISDFYDQAKQYPVMVPMAKILDNWGVQMVLSLKTEEKGTLNPTVGVDTTKSGHCSILAQWSSNNKLGCDSN